MFYVGIDIAKRTHEAAVLDKDGKTLCKPFQFSNSNAGCEKILAILAKHEVSKEDVIVAMCKLSYRFIVRSSVKRTRFIH